MYTLVREASKCWITLSMITLLAAGVISTDEYPDLLSPTPEISNTTVPLSAFVIGIRILNWDYSDVFADRSSHGYWSLRESVEQLMSTIYSRSTAEKYIETSDVTFSNGSVIANSTVVFGATPTPELVGSVFLRQYRMFLSPALQLDTSYTEQFPPVPVPVLLDNATLPTTMPPATHSTLAVSSSTHVSNPTERNTTTSIPGNHTTDNVTAPTPTAFPSNTTLSYNQSATAGHPTERTTGSGSMSTPSWTAPPWTGVPDWGLALLVLSAIALLLLIIILILQVVWWCCAGRQRGFMNVSGDPYPPEQTYYNPDIPLYATHSTVDVNAKPGDNPEKPPKNRTGMYVVNK